MTRRGRPPLSPSKRRGYTISIRLTTEERTSIERAAELEGRTASRWATRVLVSAARRRITGALP